MRLNNWLVTVAFFRKTSVIEQFSGCWVHVWFTSRLGKDHSLSHFFKLIGELLLYLPVPLLGSITFARECFFVNSWWFQFFKLAFCRLSASLTILGFRNFRKSIAGVLFLLESILIGLDCFLYQVRSQNTDECVRHKPKNSAIELLWRWLLDLRNHDSWKHTKTKNNQVEFYLWAHRRCSSFVLECGCFFSIRRHLFFAEFVECIFVFLLIVQQEVFNLFFGGIFSHVWLGWC